MKSQPNGVVIWRGPSRFDRAPIFVAVTGLARPTSNRKTGDMLQTWILAEHEPPTARGQYDTGTQPSACGRCPLGHGLCYVNWNAAPLSVWRRYRSEPVTDPRGVADGHAVRLGAAGDPAMVPVSVWRALLTGARSWTGYTHQAGQLDCRALRPLLMRSTETEEQTRRAWGQGWRTFRVRARGAPLLAGEINCPSRPGFPCERCGLCRGTAVRGPSVSIEAHGSPVFAKARNELLRGHHG